MKTNKTIRDLKKLKENIGDKLYNELNQQQRDWIVRTEGSIKLNRDYTKEDFERISDYLNFTKTALLTELLRSLRKANNEVGNTNFGRVGQYLSTADKCIEALQSLKDK